MLDQRLYSMPRGNVETRWASPENPRAARGAGGRTNGGRKGSPFRSLRPGERLVLAEESGGSGTVRRIWSTLDDRSPDMLQSLRLRCWWDGAGAPAVDAPFGDFFGVALGRTAAFESALFSSPEGRSFISIVPMPFRDGMRIEVANTGERTLNMFFYDVEYTVNDPHGDDALYFHACCRRERETTLTRDYEIVPATAGRGRFLGANLGMRANTERYLDTWWGEGEVKIYLDGDLDFPSLCGTGTEDYIGTAWEQGRFAHLYQGCTVADRERMEFCFYRYHVPDPVFFHRDIRVTIQQIGGCSAEHRPRFREAGAVLQLASGEGGYLDWDDPAKEQAWENFERSDDWSSCAYLYLDRPGGIVRP